MLGRFLAVAKGWKHPEEFKCWCLLLPTCFWELLHMICHHAVTVGPSLCPRAQFRWSFSICHSCERKEPHTGSWLFLRAEVLTCQLSSDGTHNTGHWHPQQIKNNFQLQILDKITRFLGSLAVQAFIPKLWVLISFFFCCFFFFFLKFKRHFYSL